MPGICGYFDPSGQLNQHTLQRMLSVLATQPDQVKDKICTSWAGLGLVNYPGREGIVSGINGGHYAVLGDLEALDSKPLSHANIAQQCFDQPDGPSNLPAIRGGFVAATMNQRDQSLTLISDRYGSYPLYIAQSNGAWLFASQIKSILAVLPSPARLDPVSVSTMLTIGEVVGNRTLIEGIETIPAGSALQFSAAGIKRQKYWQYVYEADPNSDWDESVDRVGTALSEAVRRSLSHSHDLAVPLSGGLDSRFILDLASHQRSTLTAYTWGTPGCRDITYAKDVAQRLNVRHEVHFFAPDYLARYGEQGVWLTEGQTPATNFHVLPYVDHLASHGHDLILDGFAGDGVLGGNFINSAWTDNPDLNAAAQSIWQWRRTGFDGAWDAAELASQREIASETFRNLYLDYPGGKSMDKAMAFLIDNRVRRITTCGTELFRSRMLVKQPFMDADVTEAIRTLPHAWRKRHHFYLAVLKKFAPLSAQASYQRTMLPASAPYSINLLSMAFQRAYGTLQKKAGLPNLFRGKSPSDFASWFKNELRPYVEGILLSERCISRGTIPPEMLRKVVSMHMEGERDFSSLIGAMLSIEIFCRLFLDDLDGSLKRFGREV